MQGHICSTLEGGRLGGGREENLRLNFFIFFFPSTQLSHVEKDEILRSNGEFLVSSESSSVSGGENSIYECFALCMQHLIFLCIIHEFEDLPTTIS